MFFWEKNLYNIFWIINLVMKCYCLSYYFCRKFSLNEICWKFCFHLSLNIFFFQSTCAKIDWYNLNIVKHLWRQLRNINCHLNTFNIIKFAVVKSMILTLFQTPKHFYRISNKGLDNLVSGLVLSTTITSPMKITVIISIIE